MKQFLILIIITIIIIRQFIKKFGQVLKVNEHQISLQVSVCVCDREIRWKPYHTHNVLSCGEGTLINHIMAFRANYLQGATMLSGTNT